jgi:hypothetical protein
MHYALAIGNRLAGEALFLLSDELEELAAENLRSARALAERIAETQLGHGWEPSRVGYTGSVSLERRSVFPNQGAAPYAGRMAPLDALEAETTAIGGDGCSLRRARR